MEEIYLGSMAKSVKDLSEIGFDCGFFHNPIGNHSLIRYGDYYLTSFRAFGYYITSELQQYVYTPNMVLQHPEEHIFCLLDGDFNFVRRLNLVENTYYKPSEFSDNRTYLEDGRLCEWDGEIYLTSATFYTRNNRYEKMGLEVQRLTVDGDEIRASHYWNSCEHGIIGRHKNWMPIPGKPYKYISATYDNGSQMIDMSADRSTEGGICEGDMFRGNTPLLETESGYVTITHKVTSDEWGRKRYVNYLTEYNADLSVRRISKPFKLTDSNIEFVTTLLELPNGDIAVGVTEMDDKPLMMIFDKTDFMKVLW